MQILLDTGPWVALLCRDDKYHDWAKQQFVDGVGFHFDGQSRYADSTFYVKHGIPAQQREVGA